MVSPLDVLRLEMVYKLKVILFLMSAYNVFMMVFAAYATVLWGLTILVTILCLAFIVNALVVMLVIRGKVFSEEVLLNDKFN